MPRRGGGLGLCFVYRGYLLLLYARGVFILITSWGNVQGPSRLTAILDGKRRRDALSGMGYEYFLFGIRCCVWCVLSSSEMVLEHQRCEGGKTKSARVQKQRMISPSQMPSRSYATKNRVPRQSIIVQLVKAPAPE